MNYGQPFCSNEDCTRNTDKGKEFCKEHDPIFQEYLRDIKTILRPSLMIVLDFVERWNKQDEERRVAEAAGDLGVWLK